MSHVMVGPAFINVVPWSTILLLLLLPQDRGASFLLSCNGMPPHDGNFRVRRTPVGRLRRRPIPSSAAALSLPSGRQGRGSMLLSSDDNMNLTGIATFLGGGGGGSRRKFLAVAISALLSSSLALEVYSRIGSLLFVDTTDDELIPAPTGPSSWGGTEHVTVVFHGAGGQDVYTDELMKNLKDNDHRRDASKSGRASSRYSYIVDWSAYSTNLFQASYNGERIGRDLARRLLQKQPDLKTIHLIGISVGSFAANAAATEIKQGATDGRPRPARTAPTAGPFVQLTLLDPFTQRGIFGWGYGNRNFGKCADYTEQYLNTDDPVPSTNDPLEHAVCYDVTDLRPEHIPGHDWPLVFYARSKTVGQLVGDDENERSKAGVVLKIVG
jgi:hypothetical protein